MIFPSPTKRYFYETVLKLKEEGKIRHFGISFHDKSAVLEKILTEYPQIKVVQIQFNYPNWWGTLPQPLFTFLEEYDFSGKTILPLCTHAGSRMGSSERDIASLCPNANLLEGLAVSGSSAASAQPDVESWITNSGILK